MRFMYIVTSPRSDVGPTPQLLEAMHKLAALRFRLHETEERLLDELRTLRRGLRATQDGARMAVATALSLAMIGNLPDPGGGQAMRIKDIFSREQLRWSDIGYGAVDSSPPIGSADLWK